MNDYNYQLEEEYKAYISNADIDVANVNILTKGSKNVIIDDNGKVQFRKGTTKEGTKPPMSEIAGVTYTEKGIQYAKTWKTSFGKELPIRYSRYQYFSSNYFIPEVLFNGNWQALTPKNSVFLMDTFTSCTIYDRSKNKDTFITTGRYAGGSVSYMWDGGVANMWYHSGNSITLSSSTWRKQGFTYESPSYGRFMLNGTNYTFTGGLDTDTLTGITPTIVDAGDGVVTSILLSFNHNINTTYSVDFQADICFNYFNHLVLGSTASREVYLSKNSDYKDFSFTTALRQSGEGGQVRLDDIVKAININDDGTLAVSAGDSYHFSIKFKDVQIGSTSGEIIVVDGVKTSYGQSALNNNCIINTKNGNVVLTTDGTIDYLSRATAGNDRFMESLPISNDIRPDLEQFDLTNANLFYFKGYLYVCLPKASATESVVLMYNMIKKFWQAPIYVDCSFMSVINNKLVFHSQVEDNSYNAFIGLGDKNDTVNISSVIAQSYKNGGDRSIYKAYTGFYLEAKMLSSLNGATLDIEEGWKGTTDTKSFTFGMSDGAPHVETGSYTIVNNRESLIIDDYDYLFSKYRRIFPASLSTNELFEVRATISYTGMQKMKLVASGFDLTVAGTHNGNLIKVS